MSANQGILLAVYGVSRDEHGAVIATNIPLWRGGLPAGFTTTLDLPMASYTDLRIVIEPLGESGLSIESKAMATVEKIAELIRESGLINGGDPDDDRRDE